MLRFPLVKKVLLQLQMKTDWRFLAGIFILPKSASYNCWRHFQITTIRKPKKTRKAEKCKQLK